MNKRVKKKWIKALTSGKYKQCKGKLKRGEAKPRYCCLGVLCDLYDKEVSKKNIWKRGEFLKNKLDLPTEVIKWAALNGADPFVNADGGRTLSCLNDNIGLDFKSIARIIEEKL